MQIPKGFKLVPVIATLEMKNAGWQECERQGIDPESIEMQTVWCAMHIKAVAPMQNDPQPIYDEALERELFGFWSSTHEYLGGCTLHAGADGIYADADLQHAWESWLARAQSRAKSVEVGDE